MFRHRLFLPVIAVLVLILTSGCNTKSADESRINGNVSDAVRKNVNSESENMQTVPKVKNPLTGLDMDLAFEGRRPLAVMIENEYNARPQSGLVNADVVYEIPTEGGITRFLAIYSDKSCEEIGPVRSARPYFIEYSMEYDGIYVHYGASPQGYVDLKKLKIPAIDGVYDSVTFWRDKSRKEPHNAYTSTDKILTTSEKRGFLKEVAVKFWNFNEEDIPPVGQMLEKFKITYYKNYNVIYTYDHERKIYERAINGKPHYDRHSKETIAVKNIIVQFVKAKVVDEAGRLEIKTIGSGKGYYISDGYAVEIKWEKDAKNKRTRYFNSDGSEIGINTGNTWIQLIPQWGSFSESE